MKLSEWQERQDIKDFLQGHGTGNDKLDAGIKRYLMRIGVYDSNEELTEAGKELMKTGNFPSLSEGKYSIWFAEDPILGGIRILYYEREDTIAKDGQPYPSNIYIDTIERAKTDQSERQKVKLEDNGLNVITHNSQDQKVVYMVYRYEYNDQKLVDHYYLGVLNRGDKKVYKLEQPTSVHKDKESIKNEEQIWNDTLFPYIGGVLEGDWDKENLCLRLSVDRAQELGGNSALKDFRLGALNLTIEQGHKIDIEHMKLMPKSKLEAQKWFETLLSLEAQKNYLQQSDLDSIAELKEEDAMALYRADLRTPNVQTLAQKKVTDKLCYWHLMAPQDLKPGHELQIAEPFCLKADHHYSMRAIVHALGIKPKARWVAYYDKYVCRPHQQRYVGLLLNAIDAECSVVITNKEEMETIPQSQDTYLKRYCKVKGLKILNGQEVLEGRNVHDRYLIICDHRGQIFLWSLTNSLSHFDKGNYKWEQLDRTTDVLSKQDLTITPIDITMQGQLITYLKNNYDQ